MHPAGEGPLATPPQRRRVVLWITPADADYLQALDREGIEVVAALHNDGLRIEPPLQAAFPQILWFTIHDLFHGHAPWAVAGTDHAPAGWIDDASFRQYALCVQRLGFFPCSPVMDVVSGGSIAPSDLEDWARVHLDAALRLLESVSADEVWFDVPPHIGVDNMLALAANRSGRTCLVFEQIRFAPKFRCRRITGAGGDGGEVTSGLAWKPWIGGTAPPDLSYMRENVGRPWNEGVPERAGFLLRALAGGDWSALSARACLAARKRRWWWLMRLLEQFDPDTRLWASARWQQRRRHDRESRRRERVRSPEDLGNFVYFPLHLEPEANVHVTGGRYRNQLDAVVDLHRALPEGWSIALKENPKQTWMHRGPPFLARLAELPRVHFVDDAISSARLIAKARLVATITGTAGYETLLAGKSCLHFGEPWYAGLPGAIRFEPGLDLEDLSGQVVSREALDQGVNAMLGELGDGLVHPRFAATFHRDYNVAGLFAEAARSMALISAALR